MGTRGPVPKHSEDRKRRNTPAVDAGVEKVVVESSVDISIPTPDANWHPIALRLWDSLALSGQSRFYEPSDWALAYSLMDDLTYYKFATKRSGQMLASIYAQMSSLLITEGDRRRVGTQANDPAAKKAQDQGGLSRGRGFSQLSREADATSTLRREEQEPVHQVPQGDAPWAQQ